MSSSAQLTRMLSMVPYLLHNGDTPVDQLAEMYGVPADQVVKDLQTISWTGLPTKQWGEYIDVDIDALDGEAVARVSNADYLSRPLRFTADEAVALLLALRSLRDVASPEQLPVIDRALDKLQTLAGDRGDAVARAEVRIQAGDDEVRGAVDRALRQGLRLEITYDVASRAETTHRLVDPLRRSMRDGAVYLDAWCHSAGGLRVFRMDRIVSAAVLDEPVDHPEVTLPDSATGWFTEDNQTVTLDLQPDAHWVAEYYPLVEASEAEAVADGIRRITLPVGDPAWLRRLLLRLGDQARVAAPDGADRAARQEADEALAQYRALGLVGDKAQSGL